MIVSAAPFDSSTQAWLNTVALHGGTPTTRQQQQTDLLIKGLKADGLWPIVDRLFLFASEPNEPCAYVDVVHLGIATNVNSCGWTPGRGYSAKGVPGGYINSNFNPSNMAGSYIRDSAMVGAWANLGQLQSNNYVVGGIGIGYTYIDLQDGGQNYFAINDSNGPLFNFAATTGLAFGLFAVNRSGQTNSQAYYNGLELQFSSNPSTVLDNSPITFCGGYGYQSTFQLSFGIIAGSLTNAQHAALYTRLRNYLTGIGQPPGTPPVPPQ
jgi:hypothetical protein